MEKPLKEVVKSDKAELILKEFVPKVILASSNNIIHEVKVLQDSTIDFGIKRILKYKEHGASYLFNKYTTYLSRDAELHDFALS